MRGIEPRSDVASTGLLRAQFVSPVFSAILLAQTLTRPNLALLLFLLSLGQEQEAASAKSVRLDSALIFLQRALTR